MKSTIVLTVATLAALSVAACTAPTGSSSTDSASTGSVGQQSSACTRDDGNDDGPARYVALGDSVAYGQNGFIPYTAAARPDDKAFVGYADLFGLEEFGSRRYDNIACPGETTASFLDVTATDNGCQAYKKYFPQAMHVAYTQSQISELLQLLSANERVHTLTLSIGGNDLLVLNQSCIAKTPTDPAAIGACIQQGAPTAIGAAARNVGAIWATVLKAGFKGRFAYVTQYESNFADPIATPAFVALNGALSQVTIAAGGKVVDGFKAFQDASAAFGGDACKAGLLIPNPVQPVPAGQPACDVHPTPAGRAILAAAVDELF